MIGAIVVVSALLFGVFIVAVVAGNRAQTRLVERARMIERQREVERRQPAD